MIKHARCIFFFRLQTIPRPSLDMTTHSPKSHALSQSSALTTYSHPLGTGFSPILLLHLPLPTTLNLFTLSATIPQPKDHRNAVSTTYNPASHSILFREIMFPTISIPPCGSEANSDPSPTRRGTRMPNYPLNTHHPPWHGYQRHTLSWCRRVEGSEP